MKKIIIGITDCNKWNSYHDWFAAENVQVIKLSLKENFAEDVSKCNGIVLSGGADVHPKYYGHPEWMNRKEELKLDVNALRDEFEMKVIDMALKNRKPIFGICRGLQIANVYFGGTLIPDLKPHLNLRHLVNHSQKDGYDQLHNIQVEKDSCLWKIINPSPPPEGGSWRGTPAVNSKHHQAADKIGKGLVVSAKAEDGTVEAIEWENPNDKPFLLLVQWHPERMLIPAQFQHLSGKEQENPFSKNLKERFLNEVRKVIL